MQTSDVEASNGTLKFFDEMDTVMIRYGQGTENVRKRQMRYLYANRLFDKVEKKKKFSPSVRSPKNVGNVFFPLTHNLKITTMQRISSIEGACDVTRQ